jgi:hypothetical protein
MSFETSIMGVIDGLVADITAISKLAPNSKAAAGDFQVDLAALYKHHADVLDVYDDLGKKMLKLSGQAENAAFQRSEITGVQSALDATWGAVAGDPAHSLLGGMQGVLNLIARYADAVADVYKSYVQADSSGSADLTAAGNPHAAKIKLPSASTQA